MGLLSSAWKSIKGGFKKIGKTVKKGFQKFGKFMGKFGILGQLAMSFILPGIGGMFVKGLGSMLGLGSNITSLSTLAGNLGASAGSVAKIAGHVIEYGKIAANAVTAPFKTVTSLMTNSLKWASNQITSRVPGLDVFQFKGPVGLEGFRADLTKIGEGLKTTQFNAVKANKVRLDKLISEGADIGEGSYATPEGFYDSRLKGETRESQYTMKAQKEAHSDIVFDKKEMYSGSRFIDTPTGDTGLEPSFSTKDVYSETYELAPEAGAAPKVEEPWSLDNMAERTQEFGRSLLDKTGARTREALDPSKYIVDAGKQALLGGGPQQPKERYQYSTEQLQSSFPAVYRFTQEMERNQQDQNLNSVMASIPKSIRNEFDSSGYFDWESNTYNKFFRQSYS